jgi:hypothetical protein
MRSEPNFGVIFLLLACTVVASCRADERIWLDARINQKPVRLFFDTGAENLFLFRSAADRLGLRLPPEKSSMGWERYWAKDKHSVELLGVNRKIRIAIIELPSYISTTERDGFAGWADVSDKIVRFDALNLRVECINEVPQEAKICWQKFPLCAKGFLHRKKYGILVLNLAASKNEQQILIIDTGSASGIGVPEKRWHNWKITHSEQARTLTLASIPSAGLVAREQTFAAEFDLGPISLTDVILEETDPWSAGLAGAHHAATVGLAGLKRFDLIVDGRNQIAYIQPKATPAPSFNHNRLGAVFSPLDVASEDLVARVVERSPAFETGLRSGDRLIRLNEKDVSNWRAKASSRDSYGQTNFWEYPAGTTVYLKVRRGNETYNFAPILRDILVR